MWTASMWTASMWADPAVAASSPAPSLASAQALAANCSPGESGAAVPREASGDEAVRYAIGVAKAMGVSRRGQIVSVMVMLQETTLRNLANDGTNTLSTTWPSPGGSYWLSVARLSLKYPHDRFGQRDGANNTDSIGLFQQRPAWGWGNYGGSTGRTDPEGVVQRLLDPRWEAMAFFGGGQSASTNSGLLNVPNWESMTLTQAAEAVQQSGAPQYYTRWEASATEKVDRLSPSQPAIPLPWYRGGGQGALACVSIPSNPAAGEAGRNPVGSLDGAAIRDTSVWMGGWGLDPDAVNGTLEVHLYDYGPYGTISTRVLANRARPDVNSALNLMGSYGFEGVLPWNGPGRHTVCAYGINVVRGTDNPALGCKGVDIPGPVGHLDTAVAVSGGRITVSGWAADPQAPGAAEPVHIYVYGPGGTASAAISTGQSRPDVRSAYPWAGGSSGFRATLGGLGAGPTTVCAYAINVRPPYSNPWIGCVYNLAVSAPAAAQAETRQLESAGTAPPEPTPVSPTTAPPSEAPPSEAPPSGLTVTTAPPTTP